MRLATGMLLLLSACAAPQSKSDVAPDSLPPPSILVACLEEDWPTRGREEEQKLFERFLRTDSVQAVKGLTTDGWHEDWKRFEKALIGRAEEAGLDGNELQVCLGVIRPKPEDSLAMVPIQAYRLRSNGEDAWLIVCKWEEVVSESVRRLGIARLGLGHVRLWVISAKTHKVLGFVTCM